MYKFAQSAVLRNLSPLPLTTIRRGGTHQTVPGIFWTKAENPEHSTPFGPALAYEEPSLQTNSPHVFPLVDQKASEPMGGEKGEIIPKCVFTALWTESR